MSLESVAEERIKENDSSPGYANNIGDNLKDALDSILRGVLR